MITWWWHWGCTTFCTEALREAWIRPFESLGKVIETWLDILRSYYRFGVACHGGNLVLISTAAAVGVTLSSKEWIESLIKLAFIFRSFRLLLGKISPSTELSYSKVLRNFYFSLGLTSWFHITKLGLGKIKRLSLTHRGNWGSASRISCLRKPLDVHLIHFDEELVNLS